jgi:hypothetical protein
MPLGAEGAGARDQPDPDLLSLPDPPRRQRTLTAVLLGLAALASLAMVVSLRRDVAYALAGRAPAGLGDLRAASADALAASENAPVLAEAQLGAAGGVRYERPFVDDTFRVLPVIGRPDVWVDLRVPAGQESGRWQPPHALSGRLMRLDAAGLRHRGVREAIERASEGREHVPPSAWLLVDGETPEASRWALLFAATFLGFAVFNASGLVRLVRKVKDEPS